MSIKKQVEAILFTLGKFISQEDLAKHLNTESNQVKKSLEELRKEYQSKDSSLEIQQQDNLFKLNIKKEFGFLTNKILEDKEMDSPTTKTLAIIAYKSPVEQSDVIKLRGNKAYDHIKNLKDSGLVSSEKKGRTRLLKLTSNFFDYFDISEKEVKKALSQINESQFINILKELPKPS